ncbi:alpha/beta hydrolase [Aliikangiella sp. IMCC44653]
MKIQSQKLIIRGQVGDIQAVLDIAEGTPEVDFVAVNCHPHSLHGGSLSNKVTHTLAKAIASFGIPSLRFNFRGVGDTHGEFDEGVGEQQDLADAVAWLQARYPNKQLILTGFSFGSYVSALAAKQLNPSLLLSVAPPVKRFDFSQFQRPNCEWQVLMGDADELVEFGAVVDWVESFTPSPHLIRFEQASHFFHGRLIELREQVEQIIENHIKANSNNE